MQHLGPDGSVADEADVEDHIVAHSFEPGHRVRTLQADKQAVHVRIDSN